MKKVLIITNVITVLILFWGWVHYCLHRMPATGGCVDGACVQQPDSGPYSFDGPDAVTLVRSYTNDHWDAINTRTNPGTKFPSDSRSVWFSLRRLKGFIQTIESQSALNMSGTSGTCCDTLGIRIYFAEYTMDMLTKFKRKDPGFNPDNRDYLNKTTVLMIPTYRMTDGKDHDFNPLNPVVCNSVDTSSWNGTIMALMMNHGGIIPPPFPSRQCIDYMSSGADFMIYGVDPTATLPQLPTSTSCPD